MTAAELQMASILPKTDSLTANGGAHEFFTPVVVENNIAHAANAPAAAP